MASPATQAPARCTTAGCSCSTFGSQFYRPALCMTCYHDIAAHYPGQWRKVVEGGKVFFVADGSGQRLFARPADASDAVRGRVTVVKKGDHAAAPAAAVPAGGVSSKVDAWNSFAPGAPPPMPVAPGAAASRGRAGSSASAAGGAGGGAAARPVVHASALAAPPEGVEPSPLAPSRYPQASPAAPSEQKTVGRLVVPSYEGEGEASARPTPGRLVPGVSPAAAAAAAGAPLARTKSMYAPAGGGAQATAEDVPEAPTAVPSAALANLAIDLAALSAQLQGMAPMVSPSHSASAAAAAASSAAASGGADAAAADESASASAGVLLAAIPAAAVAQAEAAIAGSAAADAPAAAEAGVDAGASAPGGEPASAQAAPALLKPHPPPGHKRPSSAASAVPAAAAAAAAAAGGAGGGAALAPVAAPKAKPDDTAAFAAAFSDEARAAASPAPAGSPAGGAPGPAVDLSLHLSPIFSDPLLVDVAALAARGASAGVAVFSVRQPFEEDYAVPRHLIVTPFTIMAVAAHPTRLGIGVLKWERAILSLRRLTAQPLFAKDAGSAGRRGRAGSSTADGTVVSSAAAAAGAAASAAASGAAAAGASVLGFFKRAVAAAGSAVGISNGDGASGSASSAAALAAVSDQERFVPIPPRALLEDPDALARAVAHPDAVGLLASFAPETTDTVALLRVFRGGARPVRRQGFLLKRKRAAWRERAPLGPLGWKKRWFVLSPDRITYYGASPETGASAKGVIPLTGWVEVAPVGAESEAAHRALAHDATTRPHCFIVRTGATHHVFQATSAEDCEAWIRAIAINAQHVGMAQDEPHCLIMRDAADMGKLAAALQGRRRDLLAAMAPAARAVAEGQLESDLSIGGSGASGRGDATGRSEMSEAEAAAETARVAALAAELDAAEAADDYEDGDADGLDDERHHDDDDHDDYDGEDDGPAPDPAGGLSLPDAIAIAEAMGGVTEDVLSQCAPAVQERLQRHFARLQRAAARESAAAAAAAGGRGAALTPVALPGGGHAFVASRAPVGMTPAAGTEIAVLAPDGRTLVVSEASGGARRGSSTGGSTSSGGAAAMPSGAPTGEGQWAYLGDDNQPHGPFPDSVMRSWLWAGYLRPDILVRFALPLPTLLDPAEGVDDAFVPQVYVPLEALFEEPAKAFVTGEFSWLAAYKEVARYQHLLTTAVNMGLDRATAYAQVHVMKEEGLPADLSLLLDMCGVRDLAALRTQHLLEQRGGGGGGASAAPPPQARERRASATGVAGGPPPGPPPPHAYRQ